VTSAIVATVHEDRDSIEVDAGCNIRWGSGWPFFWQAAQNLTTRAGGGAALPAALRHNASGEG